MKVNAYEVLQNANDELVEVLDEHIEGMVESHLEAWKERYYPKSVDDISLDLYVNHDPSLEIEFVEEKLGRELEVGEYEMIEKFFNESVLNCFR